jgi:hypothetical protein
MNNKRRLALSVLGIAGCVLLLAACIPVTPVPIAAEEKIVGSWRAKATEQTMDKLFMLLFTFGADGSIVAGAVEPGQSTGHGAWAHGRNDEVRYTFVVLISNPAGEYAGSFVMGGTLQHDAGKDTWSGPSKTTVSDANGQVFFNSTGTFTLTQRITVEPLN